MPLQLPSHICISVPPDQDPPDLVPVSYFPGGFIVNNIQMPGAVVLYSSLSLLWRAPASPEALTPDDFPLIQLVKPTPGEWAPLQLSGFGRAGGTGGQWGEGGGQGQGNEIIHNQALMAGGALVATDIVIIGTGKSFVQVPESVQTYLKDRAISLELLSTVGGLGFLGTGLPPALMQLLPAPSNRRAMRRRHSTS